MIEVPGDVQAKREHAVFAPLNKTEIAILGGTDLYHGSDPKVSLIFNTITYTFSKAF